MTKRGGQNDRGFIWALDCPPSPFNAYITVRLRRTALRSPHVGRSFAMTVAFVVFVASVEESKKIVEL